MAKKRIMVCVTQQKSCERLLKKAILLKESPTDEVYVVHVIKDNWKYFGELRGSDALDFLFEISGEYGASMHVFNAGDIVDKLSEFACENKIDVIVMGESKEVKKHQNMIYRLKNRINRNVEFDIVSLNDLKVDNSVFEINDKKACSSVERINAGCEFVEEMKYDNKHN